MLNHFRTYQRKLLTSVDIGSIVLFRIAFGLIMLWEVARYFSYGWIEAYWIKPSFHFTYYGFGWVQPWPGNGMLLHFLLLWTLALFITLGLWYRISTILFFLGFTYIFLLEQARYLNHFYLICLVSFLMIFIPAHWAFSMDATLNPQRKSQVAPYWAVWLLRFQLGVVYFYGGLAKLNTDWLQGEPMRMWLADRTELFLIGSFLTEEWVVYLFSYGGLLLDLLIVPFLLWKRTRLDAFILITIFHLLNAELFVIGIFPWFMIIATTIFFDPSWSRHLLMRLQWLKRWIPLPEPILSSKKTFSYNPILLGLLIIYVLLQLTIPLRHHLYPGNTSWTEQGHRFSWRMKLRDKEAESTFFILDKEGIVLEIVEPEEYLTHWQARKMAATPDMILQFGHYLAEKKANLSQEPIRVQAEVVASVNQHEPQLLIDPTVDLAAQPRTLRPVHWIEPLQKD